MDLNSINIVEIDGNSKSKLKLLNPNKIRILRSTTTTSGTTTTLSRPSPVLLGSTTVSTVVSSAPSSQQIEDSVITTIETETQEEIGQLADADTQELLPHEININDMDLERGNRMSANVINVGDINEAVVVTTEVTTVTTTPVVDEDGVGVGLEDGDTENGLMVVDVPDDQEEEETEITGINNSGEILCDQEDPDDERDKIDANSNPLELSTEEELEEMDEIKNKSPSPQAPTPRTKTNVLIHKFGDIELSLVDVEDDSAEKVRTITHISKNLGNINQSGSGVGSEFSKSQNSILKSSTGQVTHVLLRQGNESEDGAKTSTSGETHDQNHNEPTQVILETETSNFSEIDASNKPKIPRNAIPRPPLRNQNTNQQNNNVENVEVEDGEEMDEENENTTSMWNQNNCIVCNVVLDPCEPSTLTSHKEGNLKLKKFFFEYLGVNESMDITNDTSFPFCFSCNEDLDKLMALACKIEFMDLQFEKLRDTLARKTVKTYLVRTRPEILDEEAEQVMDLSDEPLEGYAPKPMVNSSDLLFNQWKRQYDMIIPGRFKKFPTLMKTVDPKQRVSYYRIDAAGKHHFITTINPDMSATEQSTTPIVSTATTNNKSLQRGTKRRSYSSVVKISPSDMPTVKRVKQISSLDDSIESPTDDELMNESGGGGGEHMVLIGETHGGDMEHQHLISFDGGADEQSEDKIFKCIHCPKSFTSRSILNYHSRVHSGERPFKCNLCDKSFAQRGGLATHALVHSGEKPYNCEECGKSFRQKYHLTQHQLIHSGLKPFSCEICHKSFNVKMNLREHMRRHTGERPYRCTYCNCQGFFRKKMLRDHIVKSHPDSPLPPDLQVLGPTPKFPKVKTNNNKTMEDMQQMFHEEEAEATVLNHSTSSSSSKLISHHHANANAVSGGIKGILIKTEAGSDPNQNQNEIQQSVSMEMSHEDEADGEEPQPEDEEEDRLDDTHQHQDDELSHLQTSATTTTTTTTTLISINLNDQNDSRNQLGSILEESTTQEQVHDPDDNDNDNDGNGNSDGDIPTLGLVSMEEESDVGQNQTSERSEGPPEPILAMGKIEQQVNEENESEEVTETEVEIQMNTSSLGDGDGSGDPDHLTSNTDPDSSNLLMGDNITVTTVTVDEALEMDGVVSST